MKFVNDNQRKAVFARLGRSGYIKFSSYPGVPKMTDKEVEKLLFDVLPTDEAARALRRLEDRKRFSDASHDIAFKAYDMYDTGLSISEIAKTMGLSESAVKGCIVQFGVEPSVIGYKIEDMIPYLREVDKMVVSDDEGRMLIELAKSDDNRERLDPETDLSIPYWQDDFHSLLESIKTRSNKKTLTREADEKSEDYVSKGDWDHDKYSKRSRDSGYEETIDGYECNHCGAEFSTKASAKVHVSMCDEKESDVDKDSDDDFFNGDDGLI